MRIGIDAAYPLTPENVKARGATFVCRYLGGPDGKILHWHEAQALRKAKIDVVCVWETWGFSRPQDRAGLTRAHGQADAKEAAVQIAAAGAPANWAIYFTLDYDAPQSDEARIAAYFGGIRDVLGPRRVGCYAGYWPLKRLFDAKLIDYGWQTYAWSGGRLDPRAQLYQYHNTSTVDFNRALADDFGQWSPSVHEPPPPPLTKVQQRFLWARWRLGEGEFRGHGSDALLTFRPKELPDRVPAWWWPWLVAFLAKRKVGL